MITGIKCDGAPNAATVRIYEAGSGTPTTYEVHRTGSGEWLVDRVISIAGAEIDRDGERLPDWAREPMERCLARLK